MTNKHIINKETGRVESLWDEGSPEGDASRSAVDARDDQWDDAHRQSQSIIAAQRAMCDRCSAENLLLRARITELEREKLKLSRQVYEKTP